MISEKIPPDGNKTITVESAPDRDLRQEIAVKLVDGKLPLLEIFSDEPLFL
ncbi:MAG: hypothetical protein KAX38_07565 [Candidatus Krumholzibacteria bacterium]|nr:hypothetical protein [Candidatus Krumholzibacteria bacterium]